jgi:hypothetical protein
MPEPGPGRLDQLHVPNGVRDEPKPASSDD